MMIPGILHLWEKKRYSEIPSLLLTPIFFPFWLVGKVLFGEEKSDKFIPSIPLLESLPTWVGSGDIRLGILVGMIM